MADEGSQSCFGVLFDEFASEGEERSRYSSPSCSTQEYGLDQPQTIEVTLKIKQLIS